MKTERRSADVLLSAAMALVFGLIFYTFNTPLGPSIGSGAGQGLRAVYADF